MSSPAPQLSLSDTDVYSRVFLGLIIPGFALTTALLILYAYAAWKPVSRRYLDRVSFRLLVYALLAHLVFGIMLPLSSVAMHPGWHCDLLAFIANLTLMFSAGMCFCIALNLQLVLVHNFNGQKMEKYYILGTTFVCLICNIVPYASGKLGYAVNETCWYRSPDPEALHWLIGTQTFWLLSTSFGEVGAFLVIFGYFIIYQLDTRLFRRDNRLSGTHVSDGSHRAGSTISMFRNIILRIGLYPLVSCLLNVSGAVLDLRVMKEDRIQPNLNLADLAIYAARPLIYGLLAATDPSFTRALRALRHPESEAETSTPLAYLSTQWADPCLSTVIEMPPEEVDLDARPLDKDDQREQAQTASGEMSSTLTLGALDMMIEEGRGADDGQIGKMANTPLNRRASVVYHI
ncbi:hypothetical protein B0H19DRAFT_1250532 [Mycena capillaripes]|nr:hypothetical protein B0H19DRAFT_1250532 [Mycena capillaripes]